MRPLHIVGGGLAGLSLAAALARAGAPVIVFEKQDYPRHKVCGEFITGLDSETIDTLRLEPLLRDAHEHRSATWHTPGGRIFDAALPSPAIGISRWILDARLADEVIRAGARLETRARIQPDATTSGRGWIWANGWRREKGSRRRRGKGWVALKAHYAGLRLTGDLEMHLGEGAYVGICPVEDGKANVCMLLMAQASQPEDRKRLESALKATGLRALAARLEAAELVPRSRCAVAGFEVNARTTDAGVLALGDQSALIPPFTGHGMAMAFASAAVALPHLLDYSRGRLSWDTAADRIRNELRKRHSRRLRIANGVHPFLLRPPWQSLLCRLARRQLIPWRSLYQLTHS